MEEGDILNSIEDFADYGSGQTFLSVNSIVFLRISNKKNIRNIRVVSNCACEIYRAMTLKYQVT